MRRALTITAVFILFLAGCTSFTYPSPTPFSSSGVSGIKLPTGFRMSVYAKGLNAPRFMTMGPNNTLLVANRGDGSIVAYTKGANTSSAGHSVTLVSGLHDPTSLDLHDGYLYIGEGSDIARVQLSDDLKVGPIRRIITDLPDGGQHSTRTVLIGPDNHIYVSIGSDCNVCIESDPHRAAVWVYNMDGSGGHQYAKGLRNAVGMAINPWNQHIWVDVNGRDLLGDNIPPETVYTLINQGDYGWPRCHAGTIHDPTFGLSADACKGVQQPLVDMQAHSAPLGLAFYPPASNQFPAMYQDSLYIAFHGSWNRSQPTGHKVVRIPLKDGKVAGPVQDFATGWLSDSGDVTGRPTGLLFGSDGTMFLSDDSTGIIYHIWYQP